MADKNENREMLLNFQKKCL